MDTLAMKMVLKKKEEICVWFRSQVGMPFVGPCVAVVIRFLLIFGLYLSFPPYAERLKWMVPGWPIPDVVKPASVLFCVLSFVRFLASELPP